MMKKLGFCILLLAGAVAFETYDDNRAYVMEPNGEENYNEPNYEYQDAVPYRPDIRDDPMQSLFLYQLFNSLPNRDDSRLHMRYRPVLNVMENPLAGYGHVPYSDQMDLKGAVVKRQAAETAKIHKKPEEQKQAKDDVKKIQRKGVLAWVCYLKLCSIRNPNQKLNSNP